MFQGIGERMTKELTDALEHRGAPGEHNVRVEVLTNIHITLHDRLEGGVVDPVRLLPDEARLEQNLRATEPLVPDGDDVPTRELVGLLLVRALCRRLHLRVEVGGNIAELL